MINIEAINKDNIIHEPFDHLLIDFVDADVIKSLFSEYMENLTTFGICKDTKRVAVGRHPIVDILEDYKDQIIDKVNKLWDLDVVSISMGTSMFERNSEIDTHNDYNYDGNYSIPARGILYLNDKKVFGTKIYEDQHGPGKEVGGHPGQLLLFKVSKKSFHSAGLDTKSTGRIACNWLLSRADSPHPGN
tara:strand:- start:1024 stop:1590 length:567 start_codon:yes stop_codon:yes gene_type:complete